MKKRLEDLSRQAYASGSYRFTGFLSPSDAAAVFETDGAGSAKLWGGAEGCERVMIRFGDPEELGYEVDFPISTLKISPVNPKFAEDLSHRDYLGTLMNLGIERDTIGDMVIRNGEAFIFVSEQIAVFICENVTCVKHTNVRCSCCAGESVEITPEFEEIKLILPSLRMDAMVSKLCNLSRNAASGMFAEGRVLVNGRVCPGVSTAVTEGDVIALRGYGKFIFDGTEGETKKGNLVVSVRKYI